jgi:hypothetical protein
VFVDGRLLTTLKGSTLVAEFIRLLEDYVAARYARRTGVESAGKVS